MNKKVADFSQYLTYCSFCSNCFVAIINCWKKPYHFPPITGITTLQDVCFEYCWHSSLLKNADLRDLCLHQPFFLFYPTHEMYCWFRFRFVLFGPIVRARGVAGNSEGIQRAPLSQVIDASELCAGSVFASQIDGYTCVYVPIASTL